VRAGDGMQALDPTRSDTIYISPTGRVACKTSPFAADPTQTYTPMQFTGYERERATLKFRCPAAAYGIDCKNRDGCRCRPDVRDAAWGRVVRVPRTRDPRTLLPIHASTSSTASTTPSSRAAAACARAYRSLSSPCSPRRSRGSSPSAPSTCAASCARPELPRPTAQRPTRRVAAPPLRPARSSGHAQTGQSAQSRLFPPHFECPSNPKRPAQRTPTPNHASETPISQDPRAEDPDPLRPAAFFLRISIADCFWVC